LLNFFEVNFLYNSLAVLFSSPVSTTNRFELNPI
jgi:hypothetical protein